MAETTIDTELDEDFVGSYTSESEAPHTGQGASLTAPGQALGRRKEAVARVRLIPGTGEWKVNGVAHNPDYKYNPKLLVNQPKDAKPAIHQNGNPTRNAVRRVPPKGVSPWLGVLVDSSGCQVTGFL